MVTRSRLLGFIAWGVIWLLGNSSHFSQARAQLAPPGTLVARSRSGQFIVTALRGVQTPGGFSNLETNRGYFRLDPALVPVSCERTRSILGRYLGATPDWQGRIYVTLYPASSPDDSLKLVCEQFRDGWQYRLALPSVIERSRYVSAVVQVLLLEMSNRKSKGRSAEIPLWLTEGLSAILLDSSATQIILLPPNTAANGIMFTSTETAGVMQNPLERAHQILGTGQALTFQQLSWPTDEQLSSGAQEVYRASAQLLVSELLNLRDGRACVRNMLAELPEHLNWQFAFLHAFRQYFQRPLEVEKWWSLQVLHFTGHGLAQTWPTDESWRKLDEIVHSAVQVRTGTNDLPLRTDASLQIMIREWDRTQLTEALIYKLRDLEQLRLRVSPAMFGLVDGYRQALEIYVRTSAGKKPANDTLTTETIKQLDRLDALRSDMRPAQNSPTAAPEQSGAPPKP